ncbi:hypothetical protein M2454_000213 [Aequitasia blattaphilus]|uniref:Uncharacterized protein n=2 Tax=Lachnospiraceae TaxID=186803 RepID=A0ABT1EIJ6_9FIRM|nr:MULTISPECIES: hypothetical protein [Lachnospiraceae]MCP1100994.1 hypothetical protein [Aequitasia blattaphilus]MCP1109587.1 hypothetical protein [Ohessyouella blattaphilus]MCR8562981.1 hypothetical protein [Ohessyouella blattaphilus]MCR8613634.1 hypothetical protein [Aequitasia blattaphilus]
MKRNKYKRYGAKTKGVLAVVEALTLSLILTIPSFAAIDVGAITKPIDVIKTVLIAVVVGIGTIVLILGVVDLVTSWGDHNTGGLKTAAFKIAAGGLLVGISTLLALMGY